MQKDKYKSLLENLNIPLTPTFHFYQNGKKVAEITCKSWESDAYEICLLMKAFWTLLEDFLFCTMRRYGFLDHLYELCSSSSPSPPNSLKPSSSSPLSFKPISHSSNLHFWQSQERWLPSSFSGGPMKISLHEFVIQNPLHQYHINLLPHLSEIFCSKTHQNPPIRNFMDILPHVYKIFYSKLLEKMKDAESLVFSFDLDIDSFDLILQNGTMYIELKKKEGALCKKFNFDQMHFFNCQIFTNGVPKELESEAKDSNDQWDWMYTMELDDYFKKKGFKYYPKENWMSKIDVRFYTKDMKKYGNIPMEFLRCSTNIIKHAHINSYMTII
ncbi:hypothetical protein COP2_008440 [Malus domestica]